ncbi:MAG TPA: hypothetical protein VMH35_24035 [Streptosporangiaceae bacterium]|nr:hypothetical protein [Streptosporangiaceae bacterium]
MSDILATRTPEPDRRVAGPQDISQPIAAADKRPRLKKTLAPLILAVFGLAQFVAAFILYPSTPEGSTPDFAQVFINTNASLGIIQYEVAEHAGIAKVTISLEPFGKLPHSATVGLVFTPPVGTTFVDCPRSDCSDGSWDTGLNLSSDRQFATAEFKVKARSFGVSHNGLTAAAAIPEIDLTSSNSNPAPVTMYATYHFSAASSYDWSSYPTWAVSKSTAVWMENVPNNGDTAGREVAGTNENAQTGNENRTFAAGALLGLAGAAILAAAIEALHVRDWDGLRGLRPK